MLNRLVKDAVDIPVYAIPGMDKMGERIRFLRRAKGYDQEGLADVCGVTKSAVSQWESGQTVNIKLAVLFKLLRALGTDLPYLLYGEDRLPPDEVPPNRTTRRAM